jgi:hypothetical protein
MAGQAIRSLRQARRARVDAQHDRGRRAQQLCLEPSLLPRRRRSRGKAKCRSCGPGDRVGFCCRFQLLDNTNPTRYTKAAIRKAPQNQSPWNYVLGIIRAAELPKSTLKDFAGEFADVQRPDDVHSSHALDLLADIYAEEENSKENAEKALELLATKYDPIRANYWNFRKGLLDQPKVAA